MSILSLKSVLSQPKRELIINKSTIVRQKACVIASVTEQNGIIRLWLFQKIDNFPPPVFGGVTFGEHLTNRDEIRNRSLIMRSGLGHISEINIQGISYQCLQSSSFVIGHNASSHMVLQHFIEAGIDFSTIANADINNIELIEYQLDAFPEIDASADLTISLILREEAHEVFIDPSCKFTLKIGEHDIMHSFVDASCGKEIKFYINNLTCYDERSERIKQYQDKNMLSILRENGYDDAAIEEMKNNIPVSEICSEGDVILLITYECCDNVQLNFYTTEFLQKKVEYNYGSSSILLFGTSEKGKHGYHSRICSLKNVPADFDDAIEVELVSWHRQIPSEVIEV